MKNTKIVEEAKEVPNGSEDSLLFIFAIAVWLQERDGT